MEYLLLERRPAADAERALDEHSFTIDPFPLLGNPRQGV